MACNLVVKYDFTIIATSTLSEETAPVYSSKPKVHKDFNILVSSFTLTGSHHFDILVTSRINNLSILEFCDINSLKQLNIFMFGGNWLVRPAYGACGLNLEIVGSVCRYAVAKV